MSLETTDTVEPLLSAAEVLAFFKSVGFKIGEKTLYSRSSAGSIPSHKQHGHRYWKRSELAVYLNALFAQPKKNG